MGERQFRSAREFCATYFPKAHASGNCPCSPRRPVVRILPRPGVGPRA